MRAGNVAVKYSAEDIEVLEGLEPVRKRPGMYIAGTDTAGLHQLVYEILDNSVDEAMNGHCDAISVTLHADGTSITVSDNGRGIPVDKHPKFKKPALEIILTTLHAGGKFSNKNYKTAGGLHGVGSSVVNALSEELIATIKRDGCEYRQVFSRGVVKGPLKTVRENVKGSGTSIFFRPDPAIFNNKIKFSAEEIRRTIKTKAYLNPGLKLSFIDEPEGKSDDFCFTEGLVSCLKEQLTNRKSTIVGDEIFHIEKSEEIDVTLAFAWTDATREEWLAYANGIFTPDGGTHELGAKSGIVKAIRNYISVHDIQIKGVKLGAEDMREGLCCIVSVKLPSDKFQAQFQGQTKSKLNNPEVAPLVESVARLLEKQLNEKPSVAAAIINRIQLAAKARAASRDAVDSVRRKIGISHRLTLPGKLADCSSTRPSDCELFIVEGDSAGGSTKQGRDRQHQAVLPLRGKVLNTISASTQKVGDNKELANIVSALGCGIGDKIVPDKLRYGKVIILTDADADGMHIATLLLAFFFQFMRPLIEEGAIYIGKPPLYGIFPKGASSGGKGDKDSEKSGGKKKSRRQGGEKRKAFWAYSDEELNRIIKEQKLSSPRIVRYKGLGEMDPEVLWETTLDPESRTLLKVRMDDVQLLEESFKNLMGTDSSFRYQLIQSSAEKVELDL